jgi:hypothetical protein
LHMVYSANFQSVTDYDKIFWANSTSSSLFFFFAQKEDIRIMIGVLPKFLCKGLRKVDILTFPCLYIFSLMLFVLNNFNTFYTNSSVHEINTRYK